MSLASEMATDLEEIETDLGSHSVVINGVTAVCAPGSFTRSGKLEVGGIEVMFDLVLTIRKALFATLPKQKHKAVFGGNNFTIDTVKTDPTSTAFFKIGCYKEGRGI